MPLNETLALITPQALPSGSATEFCAFVRLAIFFLCPLLVVRIAGVIGGLIGFGVVGLFIGPVILAITYTLLQAWVQDGEPTQADRL